MTDIVHNTAARGVDNGERAVIGNRVIPRLVRQRIAVEIELDILSRRNRNGFFKRSDELYFLSIGSGVDSRRKTGVIASRDVGYIGL